MKIILIVTGVAIVLAIAAVVIRRLKVAAKEIETKVVDILTLKDVISFFKQPDVLERIKASQDLIAVAMKENVKNGGVKVILCAFNKREDKVEFPLLQYKTNSLDVELISVFGEKDMIVLK